MFLKFLYIALIGAALSQKRPAAIEFPKFEDDDVTTKPYENEAFVGGKGPNKIPLEFTVIFENPGIDEGNQTTAGEVVGNSENESLVDFVPQNTEDLPAKITTVSSVLTQTKNPGSLTCLFQIFGNAVHDVVNENSERFNSSIDSILEVGQSILHAGHNILDAKRNAIASIPRGWDKVFEALEKQ